MKLPDYRRKFSHPDIPIDVDRLREIISAGDAADQALNAEHHRRFAEISTGTPLATGRLAELRSRGDALRAQKARAGGDASLVAAIQENQKEVREEEARVEAAKAPHRAAVDLRNRCVAYALEAGLALPELRRFDVNQLGVRDGHA